MFRYAGIGSRQTPKDILKTMEDFAYVAAPWATLHTGGAPGADMAFAFGAELGGGLREIYLPWAGFNGHKHGKLDEPSQTAMEIAEYFHPRWKYLKRPAKLLHGRNTHQILGAELDTPVELVVCWTKGAKGGGGTGQALRIARDRDIEIWDLADPEMLLQAQALVGIGGIYGALLNPCGTLK